MQGLDDRVVPPSQAESLVAALTDRQIPCAYLPFAGEGHGFRGADAIRRALEAQIVFLGEVFGFTPADDLAPLEMPGLDAWRERREQVRAAAAAATAAETAAAASHRSRLRTKPPSHPRQQTWRLAPSPLAAPRTRTAGRPTPTAAPRTRTRGSPDTDGGRPREAREPAIAAGPSETSPSSPPAEGSAAR